MRRSSVERLLACRLSGSLLQQRYRAISFVTSQSICDCADDSRRLCFYFGWFSRKEASLWTLLS